MARRALQSKLNHTATFRHSYPSQVHIYFIPTNFATHVECEGWPADSDIPSQVIERLQTSQPFPGGFESSRSAFLQKLEAVGAALPPLIDGPTPKKVRVEAPSAKLGSPPSAAKPVVVPGRIIGEGEVSFGDGRGEDKFWLMEFSLPIPE